MEELLLKLLGELERFGETHEELYDSEVRERMGAAIMEGFVRNVPGHSVPNDLGMRSPHDNAFIRRALAEYIQSANAIAERLGLNTFHARLGAFQNPAVRTNPKTAVDYEELFGHTPPEWYDEAGNVLWNRVR